MADSSKPYDHSTYPQNGALGSSQALRNELDSIETGFDILAEALNDGIIGADGAATIAIAQAAIATAQAAIATAQAIVSTSGANTATTKAGEALASSNAAAGTLAAVNAVYDSFDDRYLGLKAFDPTLDNDGNALVEGTLYYSSTTKTFKGFNGTVWINLPASTAFGVAFTPSGNFSPSSTSVHLALVELDSDLGVFGANLAGLDTEFEAHLVDAIDAHDASAIGYIPSLGVTAINVQEAIAEVGIKAGLSYAETTGTSLDYIATPVVPITEYKDGVTVVLKFDKDCATNARIKFSGLNPPPDLKIRDAVGKPVNVYAGDIRIGHVTLGTFVENGTGLLIEPAIDAVSQVGIIEQFSGNTPPFGRLACPLAATALNRITYAELHAYAAANGYPWGDGDGSTTFGMPWFPANYTSVQANGNVGTNTVGDNLSHTHTQTSHSHTVTAEASGTSAAAGGVGNTGGANASRTTSAVAPAIQSIGGAANLPAGVRVQYCVRYRD